MFNKGKMPEIPAPKTIRKSNEVIEIIKNDRISKILYEYGNNYVDTLDWQRETTQDKCTELEKFIEYKDNFLRALKQIDNQKSADLQKKISGWAEEEDMISAINAIDDYKNLISEIESRIEYTGDVIISISFDTERKPKSINLEFADTKNEYKPVKDENNRNQKSTKTGLYYDKLINQVMLGMSTSGQTEIEEGEEFYNKISGPKFKARVRSNPNNPYHDRININWEYTEKSKSVLKAPDTEKLAKGKLSGLNIFNLSKHREGTYQTNIDALDGDYVKSDLNTLRQYMATELETRVNEYLNKTEKYINNFQGTIQNLIDARITI